MTISPASSASAAANTVTMPAHAIGQSIWVWTERDGSTTLPTVPSGQGWAVVGTVLGTSICGQLYMKIATATNHTTGTWTNATGIAIVVLDGAAGIGATATGSGVSSTITYPAITRQSADNSSWGLRFAAHRTATNITTNAPSNTPNTLVVGTATECVIWSSNGALSSNPASATQSVSASSGFVAMTIEVIDGTSGTGFTDNFAALDTTTQWMTLGTGTVTGTSGVARLAGTAGQEAALLSRAAYNLVGQSGSFKVSAVTGASNQMTAGLGAYYQPQQSAWWTGAHIFFITGTAQARYMINGTSTNVGSTRTHTAGDYYRIRESGGTIFWEFGTNGTSWTAWQSSAAPQLPFNWRVMAYAFFNSSTNIDLDDVVVTSPAAPSNTGAFFSMF